jgi:hypothetical protein
LHADGRKDRQTDMTKLIAAFCCFAKSNRLIVTNSLWLKCVLLTEYNIEDDRITLFGLCVRLLRRVNLYMLGIVENVVISE